MPKLVKKNLAVAVGILLALFVVARSTGALAWVSGLKPMLGVFSGETAPAVYDLGRMPATVSLKVTAFSLTDGKVFAGTNNYGHFYVFNPGAGTTADLGQGEAGGTEIRALTTGVDGRVYGGTNNNAFLFGYSATPADSVHPGQVVPGETDVASLLAATNGLVYGGSGPHAHLFRYDPGTGQIADLGIPLPGELEIVGLVQTGDGLIYGATVATNPVQAGRLFSYDPDSGAVTDLGSLGKVVTSLAASSDSVYVGTTDGSLRMYSIPGGLVDLGKPINESNVKITSLAVDNSGRVFGGVYPAKGIFRYDPSSGAVVLYSNPLQGIGETVNSLVVRGTELYLGTGPEGHLLRTSTETLAPPPGETPAAVATATVVPLPLATPESTATPLPTQEEYKNYIPLVRRD